MKTKPKKITITDEQFEQAVGEPLDGFARQCHAASIQLVKSDLFPSLGFEKRRVARGWCTGVMGQHSWVVLGDDCYDPQATIVDPTLWSYDSSVAGVWVGSGKDKRHQPHGGYGTIWDAYRPSAGDGDIIELEPEAYGKLGMVAESFLEMLGPLDRRGWNELFEAPPNGNWGAREIILAAYRTPGLRALIPIDRVGMLTDVNPSGVYLP